MSMGGSQTTTQDIPDYLDKAAQDLIAQAVAASQIGYMANPNAGVAAFTPMQASAMSANNMGMNAYGLGGVADPMAGMPQAVDMGGGVMGYSSYPLYQQATTQFAAQNPGQQAAYDALFVDPNAAPKGGKSSSKPSSGGSSSAPPGPAVYKNGQWVYS